VFLLGPALAATAGELQSNSAGGAAGQSSSSSAATYVPFEGQHTAWHDGFARYDFVMNTETMEVTPFSPPARERFGIGAPATGTRRCVVICPKTSATGNPWSWRGCYWDHQPQTEVELLRRGFHVAYISADQNLRPDKYWDAWYTYLTEKHGLSKKPAFIGMSRGGEFSFTWATTHTDKVSAIYADNPGGNDEIIRRLPDLVRKDVPVMLVCGTIDPLLSRYASAIEGIYHQFGGRVSIIIKEGAGHHPHSLIEPTPMADFIQHSVEETEPPTPDFVGTNRATRISYYSLDATYEKSPKDGYYLIRRGPAFEDFYWRYDITMGFAVPATIITPKTPAQGKPWVYRAAYVPRDAVVDQALLARGYHIVVGPVGYNFDGPVKAEWDKLYQYLVDHGFSSKPVMEGTGGAAGAVYQWAIENPQKVSCIYAENPVLKTGGVKIQPIDNLAPLAKAGVAILNVCGSADPALDEQSRVAEKRYKDLGGNLSVIIEDGKGHFDTTPKDPKAIIEFITAHSK
jgi:hypothetical protein